MSTHDHSRQPPAHTFTNELYCRPDAAAYLDMSESWLAKAAVYGGGPAFMKIGKSVRYRRQDLDEFIKDSLRRSTSDHGGANKATIRGDRHDR